MFNHAKVAAVTEGGSLFGIVEVYRRRKPVLRTLTYNKPNYLISYISKSPLIIKPAE